MKQIIFLA